jgi:RimJ/RimL family protein N-acetyltransferase
MAGNSAVLPGELLRTQRLLLRHWEEPDLPAFFDLYSQQEVTRWLGPHPRRPLATSEDARDRMNRWYRSVVRPDDPPVPEGPHLS